MRIAVETKNPSRDIYSKGFSQLHNLSQPSNEVLRIVALQGTPTSVANLFGLQFHTAVRYSERRVLQLHDLRLEQNPSTSRFGL